MSTTSLKIGQVHALLRRERPDLELSKIRYYEDQGLVKPARSKNGYRLYSERDVACLREAMRLADEEFVPLRVVRLRLIDQGLLDGSVPAKVVTKRAARSAALESVSLEAPTPATRLHAVVDGPSETSHAPTPPVTAAPVATLHDVPTTMTLQELMDRSGLAPHDVNTLVSLGLVAPATNGRGQFVTHLDLTVATAAAPLLREGADPRHLGALRRVVEREIGVLEDLTASLRHHGARDPEGAHRAFQNVIAEMAALRHALYTRALGDLPRA